MAKWAKLKPEAMQQILTNALQIEVQNALPAALQSAGIPANLIEPYLPKLLPVLAQRVGANISAGFKAQQLAVFALESSNFVQNLVVKHPEIFDGAVRPVLVGAGSQGQNTVPQVAQQGVAQQPEPLVTDTPEIQ